MGIIKNTSTSFRKIFSQKNNSSKSNTQQEASTQMHWGEIGATGVQFFSGMIRNEEYVNELKGQKGITIYDRMRRSDSQIRGTLMALSLPIRQAEWRIEPASELSEDQEIAEILQENLFEGMQNSWDDFIRQALSMYTFGHSLFEIVYKIENGLCLVDKIAPRLQKTIWEWVNDKNGNLETIQQYVQMPDGNFTYRDLPADKCLLFTHDQEGNNYEGISILRSAYKNWFIKNELYTIDALGHDRFSSGVPWMKVPDNFNNADMDDAKIILQNLHSRDKSYMIIPPRWEAGIFEKAGDNSSLMQSISHHNGEIAKNILAQFINLGSSGQSSGSYALSQAFEEMFMLSLNSGANYIAETINRKLIRKIVDLNWNVKKYPLLKHSRIILDVSKFMAAISTLGGNTLLTHDEDTENHIRDILGFPKIIIDQTETQIQVPEKKEDVEIVEQEKKTEQIKMDSTRKRQRMLTDLEAKVISIDFIEKTLDEHEKYWMSNVIKVRNQQIEQIAHDILVKPAHEVKAAYTEKMQDKILDECLRAYSNAKKQVRNEINSQKKQVKTVKSLAETIYKQGDLWDGKEVRLILRKQAEIDAVMMANKLVNTALYELSQLPYGLSIEEQEAYIIKKLKESGTKEISNTANKSIAMAYGIGREVEAQELKNDIEYAVYSVILDANACDECLPKDQVKHVLDDTDFQTPNPYCYGGAHRCRCMNIYVIEGMVGEFVTKSKEDYIRSQQKI